MTKIVTRLFDTFSDAQHAVIELERVGVPHGDISIVSHKDDKHGLAHVREPRDDTAGGVLGAAGGVLAGLGLMAIPGLGPVVAAGWLASAAVGAIVGGAVVGAAGGGGGAGAEVRGWGEGGGG